MRLRWIACLLSFAMLLGTGCEHADPVGTGGNGLEPTLSSIQENIFSTNCALSGCHANPDPVLDMNLGPGAARESIVNVASSERPEMDRIEPGQPDNSYLILKIEGDASIDGQRMPPNREPLTQEEIDVIREWVENGAPDN